MDNIVWNRPMIVLNNIVIMPDTSSHLDVISKESCEAVANAMKGDCSILLVTAKEVKENAKAPDLYPIGVTAKIKQYLKMPNKNSPNSYRGRKTCQDRIILQGRRSI